jgi:DNA-binding SARP family transcriptional activator/tetratricopeptide (TPR) repeat protein
MRESDSQPSGPLVSILGPVAVGRTEDSMTPVAQQLLRVLLASLVMAGGRVVSTATLIDALWAEDVSRERERNLQARVSALRRLLADADPGHSTARVIRVADGYRLPLAPDALDANRFASLADQGRAAARAGDQAHAAALFRQALGLWHGPALADAAPWSTRLDREAARLEELRMAVTEDRLACDLSLGAHGDVIGELAQLNADFPLRERLAWLLMLALWRCGRRGEALAAFDRTRRLLAAELGIDPGPELRHLHARLLADDPSLVLPATEPAPATAPRGRIGPHLAAAVAVPRQLPAGVGHFTGREAELKLLDELLDSSAQSGGAVVVTAVRGMAGVGKTALAVHWARTVADRFPDGQLYVNLRGFDPDGAPVAADDATSWFLGALGVPGSAIPAEPEARAGLYRSVLADRRVLLLLDNARDAAQVRPLLAGGPGCFALVTSRSTIAGLAAAQGARLIRLDQLDDADAASLLAARLGPERVERELPAVTRLVRQCAGLPLALAIVAGRAADSPGLPLAALADGLEAESSRLDVLDGGDPLTSVRSVFSWSLRHLTAPAAQMFGLLGVHRGPDISLSSAASLAALPVPAARAALTELTAASLVAEHRPGRYLLHDLLRAYAAEHAAASYGEDWCRAAMVRSFDHYVQTLLAYSGFHPMKFTADPAAPGVTPERLAGDAELTAWLRAEHLVLGQAVGQAAEAGCPAAAWRLFAIFAQSVCRTGQWQDWEHAGHTALAAARAAADDNGTGWTRLWLGTICFHFSDVNRARTELALAIAAFERSGDVHRQAIAHVYLADVLTITEWRFGQRLKQPHTDAERPPWISAGLAHAEQALSLYHQAGDPEDMLMALSVLVDYHILRGDTGLASHYADRAAAIGQQVAAPDMRALTHDMLGRAHQARGELREAILCFRSALEMLPGGTPAWAHRRAEYLAQIAEAYQALGDIQAAREAWTTAVDLLKRAGHPLAAQVRPKLSTLPGPSADQHGGV